MNTELFQFDEATLQRWQTILNLLAELMQLPVALIMRAIGEDIQVFAASQGEQNPYHPGDSERLIGSGLYCEYVLTNQKPLLVPDALHTPGWENNPDVKLGMISYLGFPLMLPNGTPFGTICVLDNKPNAYSETLQLLLEQFRDAVQHDLELVYMNQQLGVENKRLSDYLSEIKVLRGFIPICMHCKRIRDDDGYWEAVESYVTEHSEAVFSHGICPECAAKYYPEDELE